MTQKVKHFKSEWKKIKPELADKDIYLFLDFDGTLAPMRRHPDKVKLSKVNRRILENLFSLPRINIAIVSGRRLSQIRKIIGIKGITYVGNHGFEILKGQEKKVFQKDARAEKTMKLIACELREAFRKYKGVLIEDKGVTLGVHFRMAEMSKMPEIERLFDRVIKPYKARKKVLVRPGKKSWEIRPAVKWDKGRAVLKLLKEKKDNASYAVFYIGDDVTDEDAFRALKKRKNTYTAKVDRCVKKNHTFADYYFRGTLEVAEFLKMLYSVKKKEEVHV